MRSDFDRNPITYYVMLFALILLVLYLYTRPSEVETQTIWKPNAALLPIKEKERKHYLNIQLLDENKQVLDNVLVPLDIELVKVR